MSLRIAFDVDGVLADLASACRTIQNAAADPSSVGPAEPDDAPGDPRSMALAWQIITRTEDFWATLPPIEADAVPRISRLAGRYRWDTFFITDRPETAGDSTQRQTQRWLAASGFDLPSVIVARGSRGQVANALQLDYLVDDSPQNCVDALSDSQCRPILLLRDADPALESRAKKIGIVVVRSVADALALLEQAAAERSHPSLFGRMARMIGLSL